MTNRRFKDQEWFIATPNGQNYELINQAQILAVLMDLRDELKRMNAVLHCSNFLDIPHKLERIKKNTTKRRKPKVVAKPRLRAVS